MRSYDNNTWNTRPCRECLRENKANSNPSNFVSSKVHFPSQLVNWKTPKVHVCRTKVIVKRNKKTYPINCYIMQLNRRDYYKHLERVHYWIGLLKLINYSCSSYPTGASYSQNKVDGFRNPMKNELKTRPCLNIRVWNDFKHECNFS